MRSGSPWPQVVRVTVDEVTASRTSGQLVQLANWHVCVRGDELADVDMSVKKLPTQQALNGRLLKKAYKTLCSNIIHTSQNATLNLFSLAYYLLLVALLKNNNKKHPIFCIQTTVY